MKQMLESKVFSLVEPGVIEEVNKTRSLPEKGGC